MSMRTDAARASGRATSNLRRTWLELRLLCRRGVGIAAIAPELCRLIRQIMPCDSGAICWLDDEGMPIGFFHENSLPELKELFANEYQALFAGPGEYGVAWMLSQRGRTIGNWLAVDGEVERSNTYNLWMRPMGHRHLIEMRVEAGGKPRALLTFYREPGWPFTDEDVSRLAMVEPLLQRAATPDDGLIWIGDGVSEEHLIVDASGKRLISLSYGAERLLQEAHMIGQGVSLVGSLDAPPRFATDLCNQYRSVGLDTLHLPAGTGKLQVTGRPIRTVSTDSAADGDQMLITMQLERPRSVTVVADIMAMQLSPLRSEILQFAATGGRRTEAPRMFGISKESLKKHLAEIYRATGASEWTELASSLNTGKY